jgi:hypothetical protein
MAREALYLLKGEEKIWKKNRRYSLSKMAFCP